MGDGAELVARLDITAVDPRAASPIPVRFTVTNRSGRDIRIVGPDVGRPPPELGWSASLEAYRFAVLASIGIVRPRPPRFGRRSSSTPLSIDAPASSSLASGGIGSLASRKRVRSSRR